MAALPKSREVCRTDVRHLWAPTVRTTSSGRTHSDNKDHCQTLSPHILPLSVLVGPTREDPSFALIFSRIESCLSPFLTANRIWMFVEPCAMFVWKIEQFILDVKDFFGQCGGLRPV